jgi:prepilin-type N-terminal cleavage/methylation domain-containing protein
MIKMQKGFTLIELILYMGILVILISALSIIFSQLLDVQLESTAVSNVNQDGKYILAKFVYDVQSLDPAARPTDAIVSPANPGNTTNTLQIRLNSINYTYSINAANNLQIVNTNTNETNVLNSVDTSVSNLTFTRIGSGDNNDTVRVSYTVTSKTKDQSGYQTKTFQTTVGKN